MTLTSGYSLALPVFHAVRNSDGSFEKKGEVRGTAFSIGGDYMITAAHVLTGIPTSGQDLALVGISHPEKGLMAAIVAEYEDLQCDVAILRVTYSMPDLSQCFNRFQWSSKQLNPFENVRSVGYAYGLHKVDEEETVVVRGFQGHIVSSLDRFRPVGGTGSPFSVYELSFAVPRGLSGSPLLNAQGKVIVHGVVIGNSESKMLVFSSEEKVVEESSSTFVEQYESLTLGVAVRTDQLLNLDSELLGSTVEKYLSDSDLLADK